MANRTIFEDDSNVELAENFACRGKNKDLEILTQNGMEKIMNRNNWSEDDQKTLELEDILLLLDESTCMEQKIRDEIQVTTNGLEETPENSENDKGFGRTPELQHSPDTSNQRSLQSTWDDMRS